MSVNKSVWQKKKFSEFIQNCKYVWPMLNWFVQLVNKVWRKQHNLPNFSPFNFHRLWYSPLYTCICVLCMYIMYVTGWGKLALSVKSILLHNMCVAMLVAFLFMQTKWLYIHRWLGLLFYVHTWLILGPMKHVCMDHFISIPGMWKVTPLVSVLITSLKGICHSVKEEDICCILQLRHNGSIYYVTLNSCLFLLIGQIHKHNGFVCMDLSLKSVNILMWLHLKANTI